MTVIETRGGDSLKSADTPACLELSDLFSFYSEHTYEHLPVHTHVLMRCETALDWKGVRLTVPLQMQQLGARTQTDHVYTDGCMLLFCLTCMGEHITPVAQTCGGRLKLSSNPQALPFLWGKVCIDRWNRITVHQKIERPDGLEADNNLGRLRMQ